jgi:preprotein translocase subunit SecE
VCYIVLGHKRCFYFGKTHILKVGEKMKKVRRFFMGVKNEMGKVRWTNKKELLKYSIATLSCIVFFGLFFAVTDFVLALINTWIG